MQSTEKVPRHLTTIFIVKSYRCILYLKKTLIVYYISSEKSKQTVIAVYLI
jgi:hypothetical protein